MAIEKKPKKPAKKTVKKTVKKTPKKKKTPPKVKRPVGKPRYIPSQEHFETAYIGAKKGLNYEETAKSIGISLKTFQRNIDFFSPAIKKGRDQSDDKNCERVENSLLKKCMGYEYTETTTESITNLKGKVLKKLKTKVVKKQKAPSDLAIMFYLVNRSNGRFVSINKPTSGGASNEGEIRKWFDEMKKEAGNLKTNPFGESMENNA